MTTPRRPLFKDEKIGEHEYQIGRLTARDASWILIQILTKLLPAPIELKLQLNLPEVPVERTQMSAQEFHEIQDLCIMSCKRYEMVGTTKAPMPIMARPGVFAIAELEYDALTIIALTIHCLGFNIACFFDDGDLSGLLESLSAGNLFNVQT